MNFKEFYLTESKIEVDGKSFSSKAAAISYLAKQGKDFSYIQKKVDTTNANIKRYMKKENWVLDKEPKKSEAVSPKETKKVEVVVPKKEEKKNDGFIVVTEWNEPDSAIVGICTGNKEAEAIIKFRKTKTGEDENITWSKNTIKGQSSGNSAFVVYMPGDNPEVEYILAKASAEEKEMFEDDGYYVKKVTLNKPIFIWD